ncbi:ATP-dependent helicase HrpB [bacterium]|nr:ATP-dependent helicase HrpB [bacterium]
MRPNPAPPAELPIDLVLPELRAAVARHGMAVLQAPPGAGKTTRVPLDLLASGLIKGRILMLEPRRLATRAAAERMAETLGEPVGATIGYRMRGEARVGRDTRVEVVTEGILTRMIQADPGLAGVGAVIFDEFHERSLSADLGLALALEIRGALREDLVLVVMSATLDAAPVARLMGDAPIVTAEGRAFAVETRWLAQAIDTSARYETMVAAEIVAALQAVPEGGLLAFLPGEAEIRRVEAALTGRLRGCTILPLFGAMEFAAQRAALGPVEGRRVVLATSIAETSLTLPDIRIVVDGGRARRARFDPASGMSRLVTERVTRAEAEQRRGRAGRVAEGVCFRLWTKGEEGGLAPYPPAEIEAADLTGLALELALWGGADLPFLTAPPAAPMSEARDLLERLGALEGGRITPHGKALAGLPLHPRLGHMLLQAGPGAALLAALMEERDPLKGAPADLALRIKALTDLRGYEADHPWPASRPTLERIRAEARRLARAVPGQDRDYTPGQMAALAYPDRIGLRRKGEAPRWVLSGGKGAAMAPGTPLSGARLIVATDLDGDPREALVRQAAPMTEADLRALYADRIAWRDACHWSRRDGRVIARRQETFGALILDERPWDAPPEAIARAAFEGLRGLDRLPLTASARRLRARIALARTETWPAVDDAALLADPAWLLPYLTKVRTEADLKALDLTEALKARLTWDQQAEMDRLAPAAFTTPLGRQVPIDYDGEVPGIEIRLQEMFGVTRHPTVGIKRLPLRVTLLSPGHKTIQVTMDIPGFWRSSYAEVRKDMRGQYPRHPWPEDPTEAEPTLRAKPRGT